MGGFQAEVRPDLTWGGGQQQGAGEEQVEAGPMGAGEGS